MFPRMPKLLRGEDGVEAQIDGPEEIRLGILRRAAPGGPFGAIFRKRAKKNLRLLDGGPVPRGRAFLVRRQGNERNQGGRPAHLHHSDEKGGAHGGIFRPLRPVERRSGERMAGRDRRVRLLKKKDGQPSENSLRSRKVRLLRAACRGIGRDGP